MNHKVDRMAAKEPMSLRLYPECIDTIRSIRKDNKRLSNAGAVEFLAEYYEKNKAPPVEESPPVTDIVAVVPKKKPVKRFVKPTPDQLEDYMREKSASGNWQQESYDFMNHYDANGWKVGKNPMKCWKAAVRNWVKPKGFNQSAQNKAERRDAFNRSEGDKFLNADI